jgi:transmembrane sensor
MSELPLPIRTLLDAPDQMAVERVLCGWRARCAARRRNVAVAAGALVAAAAAVVVLAVRRTEDGGPLLLADRRLPQVVASGAVAHMLDRSSVAVHGGRVVVVANGARVFSTRVEGGRARFSVTPGGPRRWRVTCDGVVVEVTGTVFEVEREPTAVRVAVERGSVKVSSYRLPAPRSLGAGQWLRVSLVDSNTTPVLPVVPALSVSRDVPTAGPAVAPIAPWGQRTARSIVSAGTSWREHARRGDYDNAWRALGEGGVARVERTSTAAELLELADVARLSGHPLEAVSPLERVLRDHPRDAAAPLAAFALGRLELDALGRPDRAVAALERALALGVPRSLEDDVWARLVEALARAGRRDAMRGAAEEYLRRFPEGRRAAAVRRRLEAP